MQRRHLLAATLAVAMLGLGRTASATDQIYFPAVDNVTKILVQYINNETVRVDIATWYLSEHSVSIAIANRFAAGVPIRLIGDRGAIFEADPHTKAEFYWLANQGIPIRLRYNPWWFPEINHWKAAVFVGQNTVLFGSGNFAPNELAPFSSTNYCDETELVTDDTTLVPALEYKFDRMWNDTTDEPESIAGGPPYLMNWMDECNFENTLVPGRCDFLTQYPTPASMSINTARLTTEPPGYTFPPDLIWGQGPDFNDRLTQEIYNEKSAIDIVVYRLTVSNITQALLDQFHAGVPVRIIVDKDQYTNPLYPEYWLTHANVDTLWAAGIPVVQRMHDGCTHMKTLITSTYATNASSNYTASWQRDHDYFLPSATKPTIWQAIKNRFSTMWTDTVGFGPLITTPPLATTPASPVDGATGVGTTPTLVWSTAAYAVSYDVYLGTSPSTMHVVANVPAVMTASPPSTYSWTPSAALGGSTTYYWQIVSKDNATPVNPSMIATAQMFSFTTAGGPPPPPPPPPGPLPSPWVDQDVGPVDATGSASASGGVVTVSGAGTIWGTSDTFNFVNQSINGDVTLVARLDSMQNTNTYAKAGIMIRESSADNAAHVILDVRPTGDLEFMTRASDGGATTFLGTANLPTPTWLRLIRSGTTVTAAASADGASWTTIGSTTLNIASGALVGLAVCSVEANTVNTASFDNLTVTTGAAPPPGPLPSPWVDQDVGSVDATGSASASAGVFTVNGAGTIWGTSDTFNFVNQSINGDVTLVARLDSIQNTNTYAKAGIMIRESNAANAAHVILDVRPTGDLEFMTRPSDGAATTFLGTVHLPTPTWLRLTRSGTTVTAAASADGTTWTTIGSTPFNIVSGALVGLAVCSVEANTVNTSSFDHVTVTTGAPPNTLPSPWVDQDVGPVDAPGSASASGGVFSVNGAGTIWGTSDTFNFVSQKISGDATVVARLVSMQNTNTYAKAGIMIRESTAANAAHVILDVRPTGDLEFMTRPSDGAATTFLGTTFQPPPTWLRLTRRGTTITAEASGDGTTWTTIGSTTLSIVSDAVVGLVVCSVEANTVNTSSFDNVVVTQP